MTTNTKQISYKSQVEEIIKKEGLELLARNEDYKKIIHIHNNYQLVRQSNKPIMYYNEYKDILNNEICYDILDYSAVEVSENDFVQINEVGQDGATKQKLVNVFRFYVAYRIAKPKYGLDFMIGKTPNDINPNKINLWKGFKDIEVENTSPEEIYLFLDLIQTNLCSNDIEQTDYILRYLKHMLLYPYKKPQVAIVLPGLQGIGKDSLILLIEKWLHKTNKIFLSNSDELVGNFNDHLEGKFLVFANEATFSYDKSTAGTLKNMISGNTMLVHRKNFGRYTINNYTRLFIASNNAKEAALIENNDRRYFVADTQSTLSKDFFKTFYHELEHNNLAGKVMNWLKNEPKIVVDEDYDFQSNMPKTKTHAYIQSDKLPTILQFIIAVAEGIYDEAIKEDLPLLNDKVFIYDKANNDYVLKLQASKVFSLYDKNYNCHQKNKISQKSFGMEIKNYLPHEPKRIISYIFSINHICKMLDEQTKNPHHSQAIKDIYYKNTEK